MGNVKIKLFAGGGVYLEERVNSWIKDNGVDVIDIKYSSLGKENYDRASDRLLIIYKEKQGDNRQI